MMYAYSLRRIIWRYSPVWFRKARNQSLAYALCAWLGVLNVRFLETRDEIAYEWRFNGLVHSLEGSLNDKFDPDLKRIYIVVSAHEDYIFYRSAEDAPTEYFQPFGEHGVHNFFSAQELTNAVAYPYEFIVTVPTALGIEAQTVFDHVDTYRFAGKRPAIHWRDGFGSLVSVTYYPGSTNNG